jgi:hypothetical protein
MRSIKSWWTVAGIAIMLGLAGNAGAAALLGQWGLDGNANDTLGVHNGIVTLGSGSWSVPASGGKYGNALKFDGSLTSIRLEPAGTGSTLGANSFTLSAWIYRTGAGSSSTTGTGGIDIVPVLSKGSPEADGSNVDANYVLGLTTGGLVAADFETYDNDGMNVGGNAGKSGTNKPVSGNTVVPLNVWTHIAATYDGYSTWKLYVNGQLDQTLVLTVPSSLASVGIRPRFDSIQPAAIGTMIQSNGSTTSGHFAGYIDDARIYSGAMSGSEIQTTVPEPASMVLLAVGGLALLRRRRTA